MNKRIIAGLIFLLLTGCGSSRFIEGPLENQAASVMKEEIVVWHTYSDEETRIFENAVIPAFEKLHPDIKVTPVRQPYSSELKSTIISRASSGKPPDVVRMDISWVPELSSLNVLYPVSDLPDFAEAVKPLKSVTMETNLYQGRYYGLPLDVNTKIAVYNRLQLGAMGLSGPPETFAQLVQTAESNESQLGLDGLSTWSLLPYFVAFGGKLLDDSYTHAEGYLNSQASVQAMNRILLLSWKGVFNRSLILGKGDRWTSLLKGQMLMIDEGPWFYSILSSSKDNKYNLLDDTVAAPFPGKSIIGGENLVILKNTRHLQASWTFMKWMTGREAQQMMFKVGQIPTNIDAATPVEMQKNPFVMATMEGIKNPYLRPPIPKLNDVETIFTKYMLLIFTNKLPVKEGLDRAAAEIESAIR
ncbi:extracellular solute-binding protein [Paenibacillus beijingensis]|uniref:ABC transporter substrate-binding protein n=1 Tax=Paenibacillus beijingensis TaxID=1126833 RepID=A0A0D5NNY8_9BACL|nr:extracellular solute-binding protein [Paenibacillus beijingensis]AJY76986.1 hypothetical protein VN24_23550 [Paenibacillus beijingensis]